ncbi:chromosome segregation protein SMC [Candidatus Pacearchaeota archaeon]|nr:chromosome segregation protein SMC [Candidatus Pacearchaeota archaeon]
MVFIEKIVMHGFKSFANKTEIPFDNGINVVIGPNGSGKSNITDALCFVLGRLSSKSLRASKTSNLLFNGTKEKKPSHEASVEIVFNNSDKGLKVDAKEVAIERIVRRKGTSIYKINNEVKTRQEVLELLASGGIDPNGFNLVLQGEIAYLVKMRPEERRVILEEVSGISIYESRKQKSLREIEKTEQKLKEVSAVLRERTAYLKNLEEERKQALKFKELEKTLKQCKATMLKKSIDEKSKKIGEINKEVAKNNSYKDKLKEEIFKVNKEIESLELRTNEINQYIQKTTGFERESLNDEVTELNVRIASERARQENFEKRLSENQFRKSSLRQNLKELESEIESLKKESPKVSKRQSLLREKKSELEKIEAEREQLFNAKTEINSIKERIREKSKYLEKISSESKMIFGQISRMSEDISSKYINETESEIKKIESKINSLESSLGDNSSIKVELGNKLSVIDSVIERNAKIRENIPKKEICPICQTKLTESHKSHVIIGAENKIKESNMQKLNFQKKIDEINNKNREIKDSIKSLEDTLKRKQNDLSVLRNIEDKKELMKKMIDDEKQIKSEIDKLEQKQNYLSGKIEHKGTIEEKYNKLFFEMQELSSRTDENLDTTILYKEREIESVKNVLKSIDKDEIEIKNELKRMSEQIDSDEKELEKKESALDELSEKFKKLFDERAQIQEKIKDKNIMLVNKQNALGRIDEIINNLRVDTAKVSAEKESLDYEIKEFQGVEFIQGSIQFLQEKLKKSEQILATIGSVNMRALETYDSIKKEYEEIYKKVEQLERERDQILAVIAEIDNKKKKTFMKTFKAINELFTRNFLQLSSKGRAFLEIENPENMFEGGVNIVIKVAKGKYMDVTSLSGGEKTLVALSLIFAIQEYNPYAFYILDEIDAALDKRNSEFLANLLKKYIKTGQYIIISHNDSIISGADVLYGVSMNNGISKILSLEVKETQPKS